MGSCFRRNDSVVIARSEATKQSIFDLAMPSDGLLRSARNDDDGAHHSLVVPAHAGTHNHKRFLEQKLSATVPKREAAKYGSLLSQERQRRHCEKRSDEAIHLRSGDAERWIASLRSQ